MTPLLTEKCVPCRSGGSKMTADEIKELMPQIPGWEAVEENNMTVLKKTFKFKTFRQALVFTNKVGDAADAENHHPSILTEWGSTTVTWVTHTIKGLHRNDFTMAAKTNGLV